MTAGLSFGGTTHHVIDMTDPAGKLLNASSEKSVEKLSFPAMDLEIHSSAREYRTEMRKYRDECRGHCHE